MLQNDDGVTLNARVEITLDGIILHSRSGIDRNKDYREALELILARLDSIDADYEIYLDSRPVQKLPLAQRRLTFDRQASVRSRFDQLVQSMNEGSPSHGAWRRLLIKPIGSSNVRAALFPLPEPKVERLQAEQLRQVTSAHIQRAVARLLAGEDAPNFALSRDYDALTDEGRSLVPKKVFGLALEEALGFEAFPGHFSAGWGQVSFQLLEEAGLWIVPKSGSATRPRKLVTYTRPELLDLTPTEEERDWIEGNPRIVPHLRRERQPGLAKAKRAEFIAQHGRLFCEECKLDPVAKYGEEAGPACIEVHHHRVFVSDMQPRHVSITSDLKCLCASCHRVLHRKLALGLSHRDDLN